MAKKRIKHAALMFLWLLSAGLSPLIVVDGFRIVGAVAIAFMAFSGICTWIDERREI